MLHNGHIERLKTARAQCDFLYVGIYDDGTCSQLKGANFPILSLHERVLMCLACKYTDDVIIGAPFKLQEDLLKSLNVQKVMQSKHHFAEICADVSENDPYETPKKMGIYHEIECALKMSLDIIAQRVLENRERYMEKFRKKKAIQD